MRKRFVFMIIGSMLFVHTNINAEPEDNWGNGDKTPHHTPARQVASVSYDESSEQLSVTFRRAVEDAFLYVYKDGYLIGWDYLMGTIAGTTYTYSTTGSGVYTVILQIGDSNITLFEETI